MIIELTFKIVDEKNDKIDRQLKLFQWVSFIATWIHTELFWVRKKKPDNFCVNVLIAQWKSYELNVTCVFHQEVKFFISLIIRSIYRRRVVETYGM